MLIVGLLKNFYGRKNGYRHRWDARCQSPFLLFFINMNSAANFSTGPLFHFLNANIKSQSHHVVYF